MTSEQPLYTFWNDHYLAAARLAFPDVCGEHELAVGFKLTNVTGTTYGGYYWPLVNGDHDLADLTGADLTGAVANRYTRWPVGFKVPEGVIVR